MIAREAISVTSACFPSAQESNQERMGFEMPLGNLGCLKMSAHKRSMNSPVSCKFPQGSAYQPFFHVKAHVEDDLS